MTLSVWVNVGAYICIIAMFYFLFCCYANTCLLLIRVYYLIPIGVNSLLSNNTFATAVCVLLDDK